MPTLNANGLRIAFDTAGDPKAVPLLLVHGLGMQLTAWPEEFVEGLVELGFYVIRFDNRDCGLSTKFEQAGVPNLFLARLKARLGWPLRPAYRLTMPWACCRPWEWPAPMWWGSRWAVWWPRSWRRVTRSGY